MDCSSHGTFKICDLGFLRASYRIGDSDKKTSVLAADLDPAYLDKLTQPLLQRALNEELKSSRQLAAVRLKDQLHQATAKRRPVDPLARRGEEHLFDHIPDMAIRIARGSPSFMIETEW